MQQIESNTAMAPWPDLTRPELLRFTDKWLHGRMIPLHGVPPGRPSGDGSGCQCQGRL